MGKNIILTLIPCPVGMNIALIVNIAVGCWNVAKIMLDKGVGICYGWTMRISDNINEAIYSLSFRNPRGPGLHMVRCIDSKVYPRPVVEQSALAFLFAHEQGPDLTHLRKRHSECQTGFSVPRGFICSSFSTVQKHGNNQDPGNRGRSTIRGSITIRSMQ